MFKLNILKAAQRAKERTIWVYQELKLPKDTQRPKLKESKTLDSRGRVVILLFLWRQYAKLETHCFNCAPKYNLNWNVNIWLCSPQDKLFQVPGVLKYH